MTSPPSERMESPFPLRLPAGWVGRDRIGPYNAAYSHRAGAAILYATSDSVVTEADLAKAHDECLILDSSAERCRGGLPAQRILVCYRQESKSLTSENWSIMEGSTTHVFTAIVPTARYSLLAPSLRQALRSFPGKGYAVAATPEYERPQGTRVVELEVKVGAVTGNGKVMIDPDQGRAAVLLPGMPSVRTVPADLVPAWVAACTGLGPRPVPPPLGRLLADPETIEQLLDGKTVAVPDAWQRALSKVASGIQARWVVGTTEVVDAGEAGLWRIDGDGIADEPRVLTPTTATEVWRLLTGALAG